MKDLIAKIVAAVIDPLLDPLRKLTRGLMVRLRNAKARRRGFRAPKPLLVPEHAFPKNPVLIVPN